LLTAIIGRMFRQVDTGSGSLSSFRISVQAVHSALP